MAETPPPVFHQDLVQIDKTKMNTIRVLDQTAIETIQDGLKFHSIPYFPISTHFIQHYVLNDTEYPLLEGKLSQAGTEMKTRFGELVNRSYEYQKAQLKIEGIDIRIDEIEGSETLSADRINLKVRELGLERQMAQYQLMTLEQSIKQQYHEYLTWKQTVEDCLGAIQERSPDVTSHDDIPYDQIRDAQMQIKVQAWMQQLEAGKDDLTDPQKVLIQSELQRQRHQSLPAGSRE